MILLIALNFIFVAFSSASVISVPALDRNENDTIGITAVDLDASNCNKGECNFGNLVADSVRYEYLVEHSTTGGKVPDVLVLLQSNNFKGVIEKGTELKQSHLSSGLSKNAALVTGTLKGNVIRGALEKSVDEYTQTHGSPDFLQVAGGIFEFDFNTMVGNRLKSAKVLCVDCNSFTEIKNETSYNVVMTEDLSKGTFSSQNFTALNTTDSDTLEKYVKKLKVVYPAVEGRVILHNLENAPEGSSAITFTTSTLLIGIMLLLQKFMSSV